MMYTKNVFNSKIKKLTYFIHNLQHGQNSRMFLHWWDLKRRVIAAAYVFFHLVNEVRKTVSLTPF